MRQRRRSIPSRSTSMATVPGLHVRSTFDTYPQLTANREAGRAEELGMLVMNRNGRTRTVAVAGLAVLGAAAVTAGIVLQRDSSSPGKGGGTSVSQNLTGGQGVPVPAAPPRAAAVPQDVEPVLQTFTGSGLRGF